MTPGWVSSNVDSRSPVRHWPLIPFHFPLIPAIFSFIFFWRQMILTPKSCSIYLPRAILCPEFLGHGTGDSDAGLQVPPSPDSQCLHRP